MKGRCHCGAVEVTAPAPPKTVTECGCSICRRYGTLWAYYPVRGVTLAGLTEIYAWGRQYLEFHRCGACGCVVAWLPTDPVYPEAGINARMFDELDLATIPRVIEQDASVP